LRHFDALGYAQHTDPSVYVLAMFARTLLAPVLFGLVATACDSSDSIRCTTNPDCVQGGIGGACAASPTSDERWCVFPDPSCVGSRQRWGIKSGDGLAGLCAESSVDAGVPDGGEDGGVPAFDVIYIDEWKLSYDVPISGSLVIINKGASPLSFETLHVKFIDDDSPRVAAIATVNHAIPDYLSLDEAAGAVSDAARPLVGALLEERIVYEMTDLLRVDFAATGNIAYELKVSLVIQLDGLDVSLPMTIHHVPGPVIYSDPLHAVRVSAFR
jgi:hypothetical protein